MGIRDAEAFRARVAAAPLEVVQPPAAALPPAGGFQPCERHPDLVGAWTFTCPGPGCAHQLCEPCYRDAADRARDDAHQREAFQRGGPRAHMASPPPWKSEWAVYPEPVPEIGRAVRDQIRVQAARLENYYRETMRYTWPTGITTERPSGGIIDLQPDGEGTYRVQTEG